MSVQILHDHGDMLAVMYCSTSDWAFGPVFGPDKDHTASGRVESFLRFLDTYFPAEEDLNPLGRSKWRHDPRELLDSGLEIAYIRWQAQEREACE